jgi:chaperonin cofactor prefoldin
MDEPSPQSEEYIQRIQQLESNMQQLLNRVDELEAQLREFNSLGLTAAALNEKAEEEAAAAQEHMVEDPSAPITISRAEKHKLIPKKKSFFG